jgi:topoisomerase IA-like protein
LLSLKQNFKQIHCSLTSAISILADTRENGVKKTAKPWKHMHL